MEEKGYLIIVLHTHLPFIRHPEIDFSLEENWLFEALTESYMPLTETFANLVEDDVDYRITISLTPCLIAMLTDELLQTRYLRYLDDHIRLAEKEIDRFQFQPDFRLLARQYHERFEHSRELFGNKWKRDLTIIFKQLLTTGNIEITTSGATHPYFPLWELFPATLDLQIQIGVEHYRQTFGRVPRGFWLPECGFYPGIDQALSEAGIQFFFLDAHGMLNGDPRPKYGVYAPIHCPTRVAAFGRDWDSHNQVWVKEKGYPGDPAYLNWDRDIGYERELDELVPFTRQPYRIPTGIRYFCQGSGFSGKPYDRDLAVSRCICHADHFVQQCQKQVEYLYNSIGRKPVLVAMFDTEHFGHWWHEGPVWLNFMIRKMVFDQKIVKLITPLEYLSSNPTNQVVTPSMSSWGYQGYSEIWLMGRNHWIYPQIYKSIKLLDRIIEHKPIHNSNYRKAIDQYIRELLLAQSSDWAFIMQAQTAKYYAEQRVREHLGNMAKIYEQIIENNINLEWLNSLTKKNNIFSILNLSEIYMESLAKTKKNDRTD